MTLKPLFLLCMFALIVSNALADTPDDTFYTPSGKEVTIRCIKHGSLMITYPGGNIQIDPVAQQPPQTDYSLYPKADFILITHEHSDHLDPQAIATLSKPETVILLNQRSQEKLGKGSVMKNGDQRTLRDDLHLRAVPAYNTTEAHLKFHPKGRDNGYILNIDGLRIYIAGDTEDIPELSELGPIDIAFLPCNQPYTMTPQQLAKAAQAVAPRVLYPYHYGQTDMEQVQKLLNKANMEVRIRNMQ